MSARHHAPPAHRIAPHHLRRVVGTAAVAAVVVAFAVVTAIATGGHSNATRRTATGQALAPVQPAAAPVSSSGRAIAGPASGVARVSTVAVGSAPLAPAAAHGENKPGSDPLAELNALAAGLGPGGVSVAAVNLKSGVTFSYGASGGMVMGSIAKVDILEALLLTHETEHVTLSDNDVSLATSMIENSDNDAADSLWAEFGGAAVMTAADISLGIPNLVLGAGGQWGLGTTGAADQITLLKNLVATGGPLDAASQQFALGLMHNIEADQRWGVGSVADPGTVVANKNGWLAVDSDSDRWLVNSDGIVTVSGTPVLMSVLTQHNDSENDGIALVEDIAAVAGAAVSPAS